MKDIKEIYQLLLNGKRLKNIKTGCITKLEISNTADFSNPQEWDFCSKIEDLERVYKEGANIGYFDKTGKWHYDSTPPFREDIEYQIKGRITIEQWDKWKDIIKAWWGGATIQYKYLGKWEEVYGNWPTWGLENIYRIKPSKWEMGAAKWGITNEGRVFKGNSEPASYMQKFGMKYQTEEAAEKARDQMGRANLLRYWVSTLQDLDKGTYCIKCSGCGNYDYYDERSRLSITEVYMTAETAKIICDALNSEDLKLM